jgi:(R,R)-butanediol dehydrogenase / meso-butanediol dehydrogenase / diacetyl reductase
MQALRWHGREDVRLDEVPEPTTGPVADALIEVSLCGICGTDAAELRYGPGMIRTSPHPLTGQVPPVTLGHELVGTLVAGSTPRETIPLGARVTVDACLRCGTCFACRHGDYHRCREGGSVGLHLDGAFAPLVAVPGYTLVAVPDSVSDLQAALTEPFAVALHGLERAQLAAGHDVLVLGFGPIGAASALVAQALGATPYVVEIHEGRRAAAERLGLATLDGGDDLPRRARRQLGDGGADVVVDSTGVAEVVPTAIECAARGGRIALLGLPKDASAVDTRRLTLFERSLVGSLGYRHDLPRVLALVAAGRLDPAAIVGATVPLDEAPEALRRQAFEPSEIIKVVVAPTQHHTSGRQDR